MSRNATKNKENSKGLDIDSEDIIDELMDYDEEEDESDDPDPNAIISLGEDEEEYKRKRTERKFCYFLFKYFKVNNALSN